jgi:hypothetical protein
MDEKYSREKFLKTFIKELPKAITEKAITEKKSSKKSMTKVLEIIYKDLYEAYNYVYKNKNKNKNNNRLKSDIKKQPTHADMYESTFLPPEIRKYISQNAKYQLTYSLDDEDDKKSNKIKIHYTLFSEDELAHLDNYAEQTETILMWLYICRLYAAKTCVQNIDIYIYPTPFNKMLPKTNRDILAAEQVNTAYTYHCPKNGEIVIFRNEEWFKVFMHETFHTYGLDFANVPSNSNPVHTALRDIFPIESKFNATEAYAETWARIMNCAMCVFLPLKNKNDAAAFYTYMESSLELERAFSLFQCNKILSFMGMDYKDLYEESEKSALLRRNLYREKTNVFAYYILTAICMNDVAGFLDWCYTHNSSLLQFNNRSQHSLSEFGEYIKQEYKNKTLNACLQQMNEMYVHLSKKAKTRMNRLILETTRMSLLG